MINIVNFYTTIRRTIIHVLLICFKDKNFGKKFWSNTFVLEKLFAKIFTIASTQHRSILWVTKQ